MPGTHTHTRTPFIRVDVKSKLRGRSGLSIQIHTHLFGRLFVFLSPFISTISSPVCYLFSCQRHKCDGIFAYDSLVTPNLSQSWNYCRGTACPIRTVFWIFDVDRVGVWDLKGLGMANNRWIKYARTGSGINNAICQRKLTDWFWCELNLVIIFNHDSASKLIAHHPFQFIIQYFVATARSTMEGSHTPARTCVFDIDLASCCARIV